jgi:tetratricopeptide (TPR) repeat protein
MQSRRQFLHSTLNAACTTMMLSPYALLNQDSQERLEKSLTHPSYVDDAALADLAAINARYWALCKNTSIDVLSGVSGHFTTIVQLLKDSHPTHIYQQLCSQASEVALILGKTFHDMKEYNLAWQYYHFSLKIAQDVQNSDLWACGIGRIALLIIYWGEPHNALPLLQKAKQTVIPNQRTSSWLSAIEAEIHASLGDYDASLRAIDAYKQITLPTTLDDDRYSTGFNQSRAAGYEGACLIRLHKPELALPALEQALALSDITSIRRHSTLLADIGSAHAQSGNVSEACALMRLALDMTMQTKSMVVLQRIYRIRRELDRWSETGEVKSLDEQIKETHTVLNKLKEAV